MLANHTHLRHTETVIAVDVQTLASIATMIATGVAVVTFLSKSTNRRLDDLGDRIDQAREEAKADNTLLRTELKSDISELRTELKTDIAELRTELKSDISDVRTEVHQIRDDLKSDISEVRADVRALSERMSTYLTFSPQGRPQAQGE